MAWPLVGHATRCFRNQRTGNQTHWTDQTDLIRLSILVKDKREGFGSNTGEIPAHELLSEWVEYPAIRMTYMMVLPIMDFVPS